MKTKNVIQLLVILAISLGFVACEDDGANTKVKTATLSHMGFDFSAGISDTTDYTNNDGEVISWYPGGGNYDEGLFWRNDQDGLMNEQAMVGTGELSSLTEVPATLDDIQPLAVGNIHIVKCKDGYAAFKVLALDTEAWEADVEFIFTSDTTF